MLPEYQNMYLIFSIFWELSNAGVKQILLTPGRAKDSKVTVITSLPPGEIWVRLSKGKKIMLCTWTALQWSWLLSQPDSLGIKLLHPLLWGIFHHLHQNTTSADMAQPRAPAPSDPPQEEGEWPGRHWTESHSPLLSEDIYFRC